MIKISGVRKYRLILDLVESSISKSVNTIERRINIIQNVRAPLNKLYKNPFRISTLDSSCTCKTITTKMDNIRSVPQINNLILNLLISFFKHSA